MTILLLGCLAFLLPPPAAEKIPGQKQLIIIGDRFQFTPGAWAIYQIRDKSKNEDYRMYIATLDREKKRRPPASWMEIGVESQGNPAVVTRFLAEETKQGPGKLLKVIVQVSGYSPFNVPKKYFEGSDAQVSPTVSAQVVKSLEKRSVSAGKRRVEAWEVEAEDSRGSRTRAIVSEEVFPIGLVEAENGDIRMELLEWGKDASTRITGRPRAFALWILEQIANEMGKTPSP